MRSLLLAAVLLTVACESPWAVEVESPIPDTPEEYFGWFQEVAECMGVPEIATPSRFAQIHWHSAVDIYNSTDGLHALGLWVEPHRITLRTDRVFDSLVVKHELVHDVLRDGDHPPPLFERCAGI
jgi:hypothetical protein